MGAPCFKLQMAEVDPVNQGEHGQAVGGDHDRIQRKQAGGIRDSDAGFLSKFTQGRLFWALIFLNPTRRKFPNRSAQDLAANFGQNDIFLLSDWQSNHLSGLVFNHMEVIIFQQGKSMILKDRPYGLLPR